MFTNASQFDFALKQPNPFVLSPTIQIQDFTFDFTLSDVSLNCEVQVTGKNSHPPKKFDKFTIKIFSILYWGKKNSNKFTIKKNVSGVEKKIQTNSH